MTTTNMGKAVPSKQPTDLEKIALHPYARMGDYQAFAEQVQAIEELTRRIVLSTPDEDKGSAAFFIALDQANTMRNELLADMERAARGDTVKIADEGATLAIEAPQTLPATRKPRKKEKAF